MQTTLNLRLLPFSNARTYLYASLFIVGNLLLPQLCHLAPHGGLIWLPIYFFTLIGSYKYGWRVGVMTAVASPIVNSVIFGMPAGAMLPGIIVKSLLLAGAAGFAAARTKKATLLILTAVVLFYQTTGCVVEYFLSGQFSTAFADFKTGLPGMSAQILGGRLLINRLSRQSTPQP